MRSALVLTRNSRDAVTQGHALHRNAVTQGHALHRNAVTQRHALLRDAVTQLTLSCASFSRASSSRFSARVWRHCLRELQLTHTQNASVPALACGDRVRGGADPGAGVGAVTLSL